MFITKKRHCERVAEIEEKYDKKIQDLKEQLKEAKDFKALIERLASPQKISSIGGFTIAGSYDPLNSDNEIELKIADNIATLVNDELSSEIIVKQQSTKVVFLDKNGSIEKSGYTKQKPDKGYSYKLIRR